MLVHVVLSCVVLAISSQALKLPSYIKPCYRNRPDFHKCALEHAADSVPILAAGDRKYRIPEFEPLNIDELIISTSPGPIEITVKLRDLKIYGPSKAVVTHFDMEIEKHLITYDLLYPRMEVIANYNMTGKILILPVTGTGKSNGTFVNFLNKNTVGFSLTTKPDGKVYMVMGDLTSTAETERAYFHFDNLFNGNKQLGDNMNSVIEDNWRVMFNELGPSLGQANAEDTKSLLIYLFENTPFYEIFPEEGRTS